MNYKLLIDTLITIDNDGMPKPPNTRQLIDRDVRKAFLNDIKYEIQDPKSEFNHLHLSTDEKYNSITTIISIPESF